MNGSAYPTLAALVADKAQTCPDLPILTFVTINKEGGFDEELRTYQQLNQNAHALARNLSDRGIGHHDNFAVMMNNHPQFVEAMVASGVLGSAFIPIDPRTMGAKLSYMLSFTDCKGVICADYCLELVLAALPDCPQLEWLIVIPSDTYFRLPETTIPISIYEEIITPTGELLPIADQSADQAMFMLFTSGTTGNPKAVIFPHQKYMALTLIAKMRNMQADDKYYSGLSLTHVNAQSTLAAALGGEIPAVFSRKFTKSRLWEIIRRYQCTTFNLLGGMIPEIYAVPAKPDDADNPVRVIQSSGMPAHLWEKFEQRFGVKLSEGYGSTEGGGLSNPPGVGPVGSIGKPSPGWVAEILDQEGNPCPPNVEGEICFQREDGSPIVVQYYKNPEASSDKVREGWLHMGDLGHKDENGWFFFHHRVGGGVRRNGDFVNTTLVETVLAELDMIDDVFVYGVATEKNVSGEKTLVAAIVPKDKKAFSEEVLRQFCSENLERNDVPELIQLLDEIPKTISEKPIEAACIALLKEQGYI